MYSLILFTIIFAVLPEFGLQGEMYTVNKKNYYLETEQSYSWNKAIIECNKRDMYLATFESIEEWNDFYNQVLTKINFNYWLGGVGDPRTRSFIWTKTGKPIIRSMLDNDLRPNGFICEERKPPNNCCDNRYNVFLNIKGNG